MQIVARRRTMRMGRNGVTPIPIMTRRKAIKNLDQCKGVL